MALPNDYISSVIGRGRSQISLYNVTCAGHELQLRHCNSSSVPLCDHSNDVGVRCSYAGMIATSNLKQRSLYLNTIL